MENIDDIKNKLEEASYAYYNSDKKLMSDDEFDNLKDQYETITGSLFNVGAPSPIEKGTINIYHKYPELVGTLSKVNNINDLYSWLNSLDLPDDTELLISQKYDGNSVTMIYDNNKLKSALTRGRNGKGMDLSHIFKNYKSSLSGEHAIRYEIIMTYKHFGKYMSEKKVSYANPRSVVSGILGMDDGKKYSKYLTAVPLDIKFDGCSIDRNSELEWISDLYKNIDILTNSVKINWKDKDLLEKLYNKYTLDYRESLDYMIDGLVIEILDEDLRKKLGRSDDRPNYAIALKFPYMERQTKVKDIEFDFGLTGQITPVVRYKPVEFNGAIQKRTSISSYKRFKELKLGKGSDILIQYRNEVISYIEKLDTKNNKKIEPIKFIEKCPICNEPIDIITNDNGEETLAFCINEFCPGKISGRISRYIKKLDIKGIANATIEKMIANKNISNIIDMYHLTDKDIEYFGPVQSKKIIKAINSTINNVYDYEVFAGIGLKDIGKTAGKIIFKTFSFEEFVDLLKSSNKAYNKLSLLEGIGPITAETITSGLKINSKLYTELLDLFEILNVKKYKDDFKVDDIIYTICVTGSLKRMKRDELKNVLESRGHKLTGIVSSKTDLLVTNDPNSGSSKVKKALELNKKIISEDELFNLLKL